MGEIADMMLDGTLCTCCCEYLDGDSGVPTLCIACAQEAKSAAANKTHYSHITSDAAMLSMIPPKPVATVRCPTCNRRVKHNGLADHVRVMHPAIKGVS